MSQLSKEEKLRRKFEALEDRRESKNSQTTKGLVYRLFDTLTETKAKGYTWAELADMFSSEQVNIKGSTLSYYYRLIKKERGEVEQEVTGEHRKQRREKRRKQSDSEPTLEPHEDENQNPNHSQRPAFVNPYAFNPDMTDLEFRKAAKEKVEAQRAQKRKEEGR